MARFRVGLHFLPQKNLRLCVARLKAIVYQAVHAFFAPAGGPYGPFGARFSRLISLFSRNIFNLTIFTPPISDFNVLPLPLRPKRGFAAPALSRRCAVGHVPVRLSDRSEALKSKHTFLIIFL